MSRMLTPLPGEIADRQTILNLKIQHSVVKGQSPSRLEEAVVAEEGTAMSPTGSKAISSTKIQHFQDENEQLQKYLEAKWFIDVPTATKTTYYELFDHLAATNGELWKREDEARTLRSASKDSTVMHRAGELLFEITQLNDKRAEFVPMINQLFGVRVREKVYV